MSRKEIYFQGITCEIRNFSENNYFKIIIFVSNNFVSEGNSGGQSVLGILLHWLLNNGGTDKPDGRASQSHRWLCIAWKLTIKILVSS